jgi:hypothetical protein
MVTRAPFLRTQFGGYFHRDIPEEDTELTHVGPPHAVRRKFSPVLETVVRVPPAENSALDKQLMRETGRQFAQTYLKDPPLTTSR